MFALSILRFCECRRSCKINMKYLVIIICLFYFDCGAGTWKLNLYEDSSAELHILRKKVVGIKVNSLPGLDQDVSSVSMEGVQFKADDLTMRMKNINQLRWDGVGMIFQPLGDQYFFLCYLKTNPESGWFQSFGITQDSYDALNREAERRDKLDRFNMNRDKIVLEIFMPGEIQNVHEISEEREGWDVKKVSGNKLLVRMPVEDILEKKYSDYSFYAKSSK